MRTPSHATGGPATDLADALKAAQAVSFTLDVASRSLSWSEGIEVLLGTAPATYGRFIAGLEADARRRFRNAQRRAVHADEVLDDAIAYVRDDGRVVNLRIRTAIEPQFDGTVRGLIMPAPDAESLERLEARAEAATDAAERMREHLMSSVSHELRTPLNGIIGLSELLSMTDLDDEQVEYLEDIQSCAKRMTNLVEELLDMTKLHAHTLDLEVKDYDPAAVIAAVASESHGRAITKGLELIVDIPADIPRHAQGDPARLQQVLAAIVGNAVKFTDEGWVEVRARFDAAAQRLVLSVSDTGPGMAPELRDELCSSFAQADAGLTRRHEGLGVGLPLAHQLVELMGGTLAIDSEPVWGTTIELELPCETEETLVASPAASRSSYRDDGRSRAALVVCDRPRTAAVLVERLREAGLSCTGHEDLVGVTRALATLSDVDLIVVDPEIHGVDAREVAACWRMARPDLRILASRRCFEDDALLVDFGIDGCMDYPWTAETVDAALSRCFPNKDTETAEKPLRVLLVDDNRLNLEVARGILALDGHEITTAVDGRQALELAQDLDFDLILMDVMMPDMDGLTATRAIRKSADPAKPAVPIVALTANASVGDAQRCLAAGMNAHIPKPLDRTVLRATIDAVLADAVALHQETLNMPHTDSAFDREEALARAGDDEELMLELLDLFLEQEPSLMGAVRDAVEAKNAHDVERAAHALKGSLLALAADLASDVALELERLGRGGDLSAADAKFAELKAAVDHACALFRAELGQAQAA